MSDALNVKYGEVFRARSASFTTFVICPTSSKDSAFLRAFEKDLVDFYRISLWRNMRPFRCLSQKSSPISRGL